jgi:hypothetical protein
MIGVFVDQTVYTHFRNRYGHPSGFPQPRSVYDRFYDVFRSPKLDDCHIGRVGHPGMVFGHVTNDELTYFWEVGCTAGEEYLIDVNKWFIYKVGLREQFEF